MEEINPEKTAQLYTDGISSNTVYGRAYKILEEKYLIRYNVISQELEIKLRGNEHSWDLLNIDSLIIELAQSGVDIPLVKLETIMRSHLIEKYNPISEYFQKLRNWDGENHIANLCKYISTDDDKAFHYHFEKWLSRTIICALEKERINKQCLVLCNTLQNSGKTSFLRFLIPEELSSYYTENISVDKDGHIAICKNFICNADELAIFNRSDINSLKSFISKSTVKVRVPYGRKAELLYRIASFCGSTNQTEFLTDETGNVRWLVFEVKGIDFTYSEKIDIHDVWSQAFDNAYRRPDFNPELTSEDVRANEERNERFLQMTPEQEILLQYFAKSENIEDFMTTSDILLAIKTKFRIVLDTKKMGQALRKLNFIRVKHRTTQLYGYLIRWKDQ